MKRHELEHLIRAAAEITGQRELVIIGSQAVLGQYPRAPDALLISIEADIHPVHAPELGAAIELHMGEGSRFDQTHGYHADGIEGGLPPLPRGWERRLIPIHNENTNGATGLCLEVHDIAAAKYAAHREKDLRYTRGLWEAGMLDPRTLDERIRTIDIKPPEKREIVEATVRGQRELHDTGRRPRTAKTQRAGATNDTAERAEIAIRLHGQRAKHHDPAVRTYAHLQLAALASDADAAAKMLDEALAKNPDIETNDELARQLAERAAETRKAGQPIGREAALAALDDERVRAEAHKAAERPAPAPDEKAAQRRNEHDGETQGRR